MGGDSLNKLLNKGLSVPIASHEVRRASHRQRQHQRRGQFFGKSGAQHEVVDRLRRRLFKPNAHKATTVSEFGSTVANEQVSEIVDRHHPLEGYAAGSRVRHDGAERRS